MIKSWLENGFLDEDQVNLVKDILYAPKLHLIQGKMRRINEMVSRKSACSTVDEEVSCRRRDIQNAKGQPREHDRLDQVRPDLKGAE